MQAALNGTKEVSLAVVATTLVVISVFGPIAFLQGVVGQFFKQFGLTICFAMAISLFDALTIAPMLSAYVGQAKHGANTGLLYRLVQPIQDWQNQLEVFYEKVLGFVVRRPGVVLILAVVVFVLSLVVAGFVPKTFLPAQDNGEFSVGIDLPPGSSLDATTEIASKVDTVIRANPEVEYTVLTVGGGDGDANLGDFFVQLVSPKKRSMNTSQFKEKLRQQLREYARANPIVKDVDSVGGGQRPFNLNIIGPDLKALEAYSTRVYKKLKDYSALKDVDISFRSGKPEFQVATDERKAIDLGVMTTTVGNELRTQMEGTTPAVLRENGLEYDIRVRLRDDQRNLRQFFNNTFVPNINNSLVALSKIATPVVTEGPSNINRQDRGRYVQISGDIAPNGPGMGGAINDITKLLKEGEFKIPDEMSFRFVGQAENFEELTSSMLLAVTLAIMLIYLVLASLYESFITPFAIMLVLPLAACGAFYALFITRASLDLFSMIGCVMLLGVATKNSILLVDYIHQKAAEGMDRTQAIIEGGKTRLRPILMTSFALIAGMLPVAIGLNEASKQRTSMGIAVIGGLVSSTILSLVVIPAAYGYIDNARLWIRRILGLKNESTHE
jgi:HAE1 family hydrophobic/amphiphilic exporter-1